MESSEETDSGSAAFATPLLMTKRLIIGVPSPRHADQIVALANNRRVAEMVATMPHPYTASDAMRWIGQCRSEASPQVYRFAIFLRSNPDTLIGACGLVPLETDGESHLGCWIGEPFWGKGYATEAAQTVVDYAFGATDLDRIDCACRVTSPASRRVIEKCGFQCRDMMMFHSLGAGGRVAAQRYTLDRKTWQSLKTWAAA